MERVAALPYPQVYADSGIVRPEKSEVSTARHLFPLAPPQSPFKAFFRSLVKLDTLLHNRLLMLLGNPGFLSGFSYPGTGKFELAVRFIVQAQAQIHLRFVASRP